MDSDFTKCFEEESYFKKLRIEVNAIKLLTDTVLSQIDKKYKGGTFLNSKRNPVTDVLCGSITGPHKLEKLHSRINTYLQTLTLFISVSTNTTHRLPTHGLISSPKVCSLPTTCRMLWRQVEAVCRESNNHSLIRSQCATTVGVDVTMSSKSNQTENSCLRFCESCQLSTGLIKMLVNTISEEQKKYCLSKTHVSEFRTQVVNEVVDMSQWRAMSGWVTAIQGDIKWASETMALSQTRILNLLHTLDKIKEEQSRVKNNLNNELQLVQSQLAAEKAQNSYLRHQIEDLNLSLERRNAHEQSLQERINKQNQTLPILHKSAYNLKSHIDLTKILHKSLRDYVKTTLSEELRTINNRNETITRTLQQIIDISFANFKNQQAVLKTELEEKDDVIDVLQKKYAALEEQVETAQTGHFERIEAVTKEKMQKENQTQMLLRRVEVLEISLEESKKQEHFYKSKIESATQSQKIKRDPVRDMEMQRQLNKREMKRMLKENADLKSTIHQLKSMKNKPTTISK